MFKDDYALNLLYLQYRHLMRTLELPGLSNKVQDRIKNNMKSILAAITLIEVDFGH